MSPCSIILMSKLLSRLIVKRGRVSLLRGFEFKSFTRGVKIYERIHGLGSLVSPAAIGRRPIGAGTASAYAIELATDAECLSERAPGSGAACCASGPQAANVDRSIAGEFPVATH